MIDLLLLYVFAFFSALLHEIMHFIMALIFHIPIVNVKIGSDWPQLKIGKFLISPCLGISYVTTEYEPVLLLPKIKKVIYFISGIIINLFLSCIFLTVYHYTNQYIMFLASVLNLLVAIGNSLPIGNTDISTLIKLIKKSSVQNKK